MLRIFKGTGPGVILLIIMALAAMWISAFLEPRLPSPAIYEIRPMPLYSVLKMLVGQNPVPGVIISFVILSFMMFLMVHFNTTVFFINERTFLPAILYLLLSSLFPQYQVLNPVLPSVVFLMLAVMRILDSYRKPGIAYNFFDAGLMIGIGSLFYANLIWFGLLVFIGIAILRTGNIKEIAVGVLGLATPFLLTTGLYYVLGNDLALFMEDIGENMFGYSAIYDFSRLTITAIILIGLAVIVSIAHLFMGINSKKIKARKAFSILLWGFFISLILYFALPSMSVEIIWITAVPASYFLAHYFVFVRKKLIPEIIFSALFVLVMLLQGFYIYTQVT
ncbi:MAG: DUF6427 family protein [Bacteroidales bacterium]|nr:DUF6427 family protein [Bacteroidales bacterium]